MGVDGGGNRKVQRRDERVGAQGGRNRRNGGIASEKGGGHQRGPREGKRERE